LVGVPLCAGPDLEFRAVGIDASRDIDTLEESQEDEEKRQALDAHLVTEDRDLLRTSIFFSEESDHPVLIGEFRLGIAVVDDEGLAICVFGDGDASLDSCGID
jgi:hypothetical protein